MTSTVKTKDIGKMISDAYADSKFGVGIEPNTRGVLKDIHNKEIDDINSGYGYTPIPLKDGSVIELSNEIQNDSPYGVIKKGDRICYFKPNVGKSEKFTCPARRDITP